MKRCPFCSEPEAKIVMRGIWRVGRCYGCGAEGPEGKTDEEAERLWDKRALQQGMACQHCDTTEGTFQPDGVDEDQYQLFTCTRCLESIEKTAKSNNAY